MSTYPSVRKRHLPTWTQRLSRVSALAIGAIALFTIQHATGAPQDGQQFNAWTARCGKATEQAKEDTCLIVQLVSDKSSDAPLLAVEVGYVPGENQAVAQFTLPLGVLLPPGMRLAVDDSKEAGRVPFTYCDQVGCRAMIRLDDKVLGMFKKGNVLNVTVATAEGRAGTIPVSLSGFTAAFNSLK